MSKNSSNGSFKTNSKKKGVYVERKPLKEASNTTNNTQKDQPKKAPKRPSRGQKLFLASVLSLLSQSSTATQFPLEEKIIKPKKIKSDEIDNIEEVYKKNKSRYYEIENIEDYNKDQCNEVTVIETEKEKEKKKKKYKSKILNITYPSDSFEILKYNKKNLILTPSADPSDEDEELEDEELENIKWAEFLPRLVKPNSDEIAIEKEKKMNHILKEVSEGRKVNERRILEANNVNDEPQTLVSDIKKNTTKDPGFYNFFVDLLETTFSVYDIKSEYGIQGSAYSSKVDLEMDETVAKKLKVATESTKHPSIHSIHVARQNKIAQDKKPTYNDNKYSDSFHLYEPKAAKTRPKEFAKKKHRSDYLFDYKPPKPEPRIYLASQSTSNAQKKIAQKRTKKEMLLNILKEELSVPPFEEPQSLFESLKMLAKTQRKSQKNIRFEKKVDTYAENGYRSKKQILSPKRYNRDKKSKNIINMQKYSELNRQSFATTKPSTDFGKKRRVRIFEEDEKWPNSNSIEVFNIQYDNYGRRIKKITPDMDNSVSFSPIDSFYETYDLDY